MLARIENHLLMLHFDYKAIIYPVLFLSQRILTLFLFLLDEIVVVIVA